MMIAVIEPLEMVVRARFGHAGRTQVYGCCNGALRGISKGSVASYGKKPDVDCCDRALRGGCKALVWSCRKKLGDDCCDRALRDGRKGSVWSYRNKSSKSMNQIIEEHGTIHKKRAAPD